ncbi:hypothetical protein Rs2_41821 [Raphanus sativus]|nr:hypothetical protein Rs2_41821 [Raphanus sativus]
MDIYFPKANSKYASGDTSIFWLVEDFSILCAGDPYLIYLSIKSAIEEKGYIGYLSIRARTVVGGNLLFTPSTLVVLSLSFKDIDSLFSNVLYSVFKRKDYNLVFAPFETLVVGGLISIDETEEQLFIPPPNNIVIFIGGPSGAGKDAVINQLLCDHNGLRCVLIDDFISMLGGEYTAKEEDILIEVPTKKDLFGLPMHMLPKTAVFIFLVVNSDLSMPIKTGQEELLLSEARDEACYLGFEYLVVETRGSHHGDAVKLLKSIIKSKKSKLVRISGGNEREA